MTGPRLVKGGIVQVDPTTGTRLKVIALQYNPDSLSRTLQIQASGTDGGDRSQALRLRGPAVETIKLEAEVDATDQLAVVDGTAVSVGIHPQLAALELLIQPSVSALQTNDALSRSGVLEVLPIEAPLTLFVWGRNRVVPVRITDLSVTEEAFDVNLNPIRAKVSLGFRVLSVDDLGFDNRGGAVFLAHMRSREALGGRSASVNLSTLGLEVI